tara:strand:+ start:323 stop:712 length:390 start_codon:yes stop_codon:yes gene_type:complete
VNVLKDDVNVLNASDERFQCNRVTMVDVFRPPHAGMLDDFQPIHARFEYWDYWKIFIRDEFRLHLVLRTDIPMDVMNVLAIQNVHASTSFGTSIAELATHCPLGWKRTLTRNCHLATSKFGTSLTDPAI